MRWLSLLLNAPMVHAIVKGISLYGCETELRNFVCSWVHDVEYYVPKLKQMGFNTIRVPFSYQYITENNWQALDHGMDVFFRNNMSVLLDYHRTWNTHQSFDPFENITRDQFISAWLTIIARYSFFPNFKGINAYNEFQGLDYNYAKQYHLDLFNKVEELYPLKYQYYVTGTSWAGNVSGIYLGQVPYKDRVFYSVHKYSWSGTADEPDWENSFGNVGIPLDKIIIGEWGWFSEKPEQVEWASRFIQYLKKKQIRNTCYWTMAHSHDTGNLLQDDCEVVKWDQYLLLRSLWEYDRKKHLRVI